jgi:hypothetical protein
LFRPYSAALKRYPDTHSTKENKIRQQFKIVPTQSAGTSLGAGALRRSMTEFNVFE